MTRPVVRLNSVRTIFALGIGVVLVRAAQVQLVDGRRYAETAASQRTEREVLPARRGTIYDRNGMTLAFTLETFHVGVAPNELRDHERDAREIARRLGLPRREVERQLRQSWAYFHGPFMSAQVQPLRGIHGVHPSSELVRFYPDPDFARPVLGRPATDGRQAGGIERVLDTLLAGTPGSAVVLRDRRGRTYQSPARLDAFPVPGHDVYLTIDGGLQEIVQNALDDALQQLDASAGDVVVLNPRTGEILAVTSRTQDKQSTAGAFTAVFEPGSTAKVFAAAALLAGGLAHPTDSVWTEQGTYVTEHRTIKDDHPSGWLSLRQVIELSSNIGIVKLAQRLSPVAQYEMLRDFGFGTPAGVEYPIESPGILRKPHTWSALTMGSLAMGYELAVTPLQLAQAYAAIANDGVLMRPTLVREVRDPDGETVYLHRPEPVRRVISAQVAQRIRAALRGVVYRGGTGETAALTSYEVAGKTGTVRRAGPGGYIPGSYTTSFASLFPAEQPQLVMVVKLDNPTGTYARVTAAPLTRAVLEQVLAAQTGALDRARLSGPTAPRRIPATSGGGAAPYVVSWPPPDRPDSASSRTVPDVTGLSLRAAARRLHQEGLRMRLTGWGIVQHTDPAAGAVVPPGTLVEVFGRNDRAPR